MDKELINKILKFRNDRNWEQFHTGQNLAKSIVIEAAELLEVYQWDDKEKSVDKVKEELADVLIYCVLLAEKYNLNIEDIIKEKLDSNNKKYPVDKAFGSAKKYDELEGK